jgi:hypothetical protein
MNAEDVIAGHAFVPKKRGKSKAGQGEQQRNPGANGRTSFAQ